MESEYPASLPMHTSLFLSLSHLSYNFLCFVFVGIHCIVIQTRSNDLTWKLKSNLPSEHGKKRLYLGLTAIALGLQPKKRICESQGKLPGKGFATEGTVFG